MTIHCTVKVTALHCTVKVRQYIVLQLNTILLLNEAEINGKLVDIFLYKHHFHSNDKIIRREVFRKHVSINNKKNNKRKVIHVQ